MRPNQRLSRAAEDREAHQRRAGAPRHGWQTARRVGQGERSDRGQLVHAAYRDGGVGVGRGLEGLEMDFVN